jgi:hypothetical protein
LRTTSLSSAIRIRWPGAGPTETSSMCCSKEPYEGCRQVATLEPYGDWIACLSKTENCAGMLGQLGSRNKSRATRCDRVALFSIESRSSCFPIKLLGGGAVLPAPYPVS